MPDMMGIVQLREIRAPFGFRKILPKIIKTSSVCILFGALLLIFASATTTKAAIITGNVINDSTQYEPDVLIEFYPVWNKNTIMYSIQTNTSGYFELDMAEDSYFIRISAAPYITQWFSYYGNTRYPQYSTWVEALSPIQLSVKSTPVYNPPSSVINLSILDSTGTPYSTSQYNVKIIRDIDYAIVKSRFLEAQGSSIAIDSLQPGNYAIFIDAPPYPPQYYDTQRNSRDPNFFFSIGSNDTASVQVQLSNNLSGSGYLIGKCLTESGSPASGESVLLYNPPNLTNPVYSVVTDTNGVFLFDKIAYGEFYLKIEQGTYPAQWYQQSINHTTLFPQDFVRSSSSAYDTLSVLLSVSPYDNTPRNFIKVVVNDEFGNFLVAGRSVELIGSYTGSVHNLTFDSKSAAFTTSNVSAGEYSLRFDFAGYPVQYYSQYGNSVYDGYRIGIGSADTILLQTNLIPGRDSTGNFGNVDIMVSDISGPVRNAAVNIVDPSGATLNTGYTDDKGMTSTLRNSVQKFCLQINAPGYPLQYWSPEGPTTNVSNINNYYAVPGDTSHLKLTLLANPPFISDSTDTPVESSALEGYVFNQTGAPVYFARILLLTPDFARQ